MGSTFLDLFSAKMALELGVADAARARAALQAADAAGGGFLRELQKSGVEAEQVKLVEQGARRCLYLKGEDTYRRLLGQALPNLPAPEVQALAQQAQRANKRLGLALLEAKLIDEPRDRDLVARCQQSLEREGAEAVKALRDAQWQGIDSPSKMIAAVATASAGRSAAATSRRVKKEKVSGRAARPAVAQQGGASAPPVEDAAVAVQTPREPMAAPARRAAPPPSPPRSHPPLRRRPPMAAPLPTTGGLETIGQSDEITSEMGAPGSAAIMPPELAGSGLEEKYRVERKLGEGGMGAVYLAFAKEDAGREKPMALKVVRSVAGAEQKSKEAAARFKREILATSFCAHENIIEIYDANETKDHSYYMAMSYLEGDQLDEVLKREGALPVGRIVDLVEQVLQGMVAYHAANIVHRDIKPQNFRVWRGADGREHLKIMDFGIARILDAADSGVGEQFYKTISGKITGSPAYLSPESITDPDHVDPRADLYSLGITIYRLAANRLPFVAREASEFLPLHLYSKPPSLKEIAADCPDALEAFYFKLLEKVPSKRPASAAEALDLLRKSVRPAMGGLPPIVDDTRTVQDLAPLPIPTPPAIAPLPPLPATPPPVTPVDVPVERRSSEKPTEKLAPNEQPDEQPGAKSPSSERPRSGEKPPGKAPSSEKPSWPSRNNPANRPRGSGKLIVAIVLLLLLAGAGGLAWAHLTGRYVIPGVPGSPK